MNQEEELYFKVLSKQGREAWTIFKNPMYRGALEIAQNLYKDKAHFVYELLHNADNQGATHFSMRTKSRNKLNLMLWHNRSIKSICWLTNANGQPKRMANN